MATRSMPFWPRPATTSGSSWPGSGLCAPFSGRLSWSGITRAAPPPHPPERPNSLFHRRLAIDPLEVPDHVHAEIPTGRHRGRAHGLGVERSAGFFHEAVEPGSEQHLLQAVVEDVAR